MNAALVYLATANLVAFAVMGWDKASAQRGGRRIPERTLLILAAIGGALGALAAQRTFRHKTRKQPFAAWLLAITTLQLLVLFLLVANTGRASGFAIP